MRCSRNLLALAAVFVALPLLAPRAGAQVEIWSREGAATLEAYGYNVAAGGDWDGDGFPDLIESSTNANGGSRGGVDVRSGATGAPIRHFDGEADGDTFGVNAKDAGDTDGDGTSDLIVGARMHSTVAGSKVGRAYLYSGKDGSLLHLFDGETAGDLFGDEVQGLGDVDGDGRSDFAIVALLHASGPFADAGKIYVYSGASYALLYSLEGQGPIDHLGVIMGGGFDADGDGSGDFLATALHDGPNGVDSGIACIYSGATGALIHEWDGEAAGDEFGIAVGARSADVDGDGIVDFLVGAWMHHGPNGLGSGKAYVYSGSDFSLIGAIDGGGVGDHLGQRLTILGDLNGDGHAELAIPSLHADGPLGVDQGIVTIYSGRTLRPLATMAGEGAGFQFGNSVAPLGDVDGDHLSDLAVGSVTFDGIAGPKCGKAYVFRGEDLYLDAEPDAVAANQTLTLATRGGIPGKATILVVVDLNGTPMFLNVAGVLTFDPDGELVLAAPAPPGLSGLVATFRAYGVNPAFKPKLRDSNDVVVTFL